MGTKVLMKFHEEIFIAIFPEGSIIIISFIKNIGFEPIKSHSLEIGKGIVDLCLVGLESLGAFIKVELALDNKGTEFSLISTIKGVGFSVFAYEEDVESKVS